ncbi:hypothetical protein HJFPF1_04917 [Paramyrothecium foliicola]|nr:hypothetical protein HJFPF1_04917 [Paramyrothecium foliicola]
MSISRCILPALAAWCARPVWADPIWNKLLARDATESRPQYLDMPFYEWEEAIAKPNATSRPHFVQGYDVSKIFPGTRVDGWKLTLSIIGNYPLRPDEYLSGAGLQFEAPLQLRNSSQDESWGGCLVNYWIEHDVGADVAGDCRGILSDPCWDELRREVERGACIGNTTIPPSCADELSRSDHFLWAARGSTAGEFSASPLRRVLHEPNDLEPYDTMTRRVFMSIIGYTDNTRPGRSGPAGRTAQGILSCLRANEFTTGSRNPNVNADDSGGANGADDAEGGAADLLPYGLGLKAAVVTISATAWLGAVM